MGDLTEHFNLEEFLSANDPVRAIPMPCQANLKRLCEDILEPWRTTYGSGLHILSGYRSPKHNADVGGASASQHLYGDAADVRDPLLPCDIEWQIRNAAYLTTNPKVGGIGLYLTQGFVHVDHRWRIHKQAGPKDGLVTMWYQDTIGYHPLNTELRQRLENAGAVNIA